jgi:hypothetical protein
MREVQGQFLSQKAGARANNGGLYKSQIVAGACSVVFVPHIAGFNMPLGSITLDQYVCAQQASTVTFCPVKTVWRNRLRLAG